MTLTCESGTISEVLFASYGNPLGTCSGGLQVNASCNSENSMSVVEKMCVGKKSCSVPASNQVFLKDPCVNVSKSLAIQVCLLH